MADLAPMRDHWWWRSGWRVGRSFYTWHVTFEDQPKAAQLLAAYAPALEQLPQLDPVSLPWLHLTMQGIGFTDEVERADVERMVDATRKRCTDLDSFQVTIGPAHVDPETIQMPVRPVEPLLAVRRAIRAAIGDVWGQENVPEAADGYRPHVTLGYSNRAGVAEPIADALTHCGDHVAEVTVTHVSLIDLNRDHKAYEWTEVATAPLGRP